MFLNFKMTSSSNFLGLGSIAAIIILLPKYLCTKLFWKWTRTWQKKVVWEMCKLVTFPNYLVILADIL